MVNEEFPRLVLEELRSIKEGQARLEKKQEIFKERLAKFDERQGKFEKSWAR